MDDAMMVLGSGVASISRQNGNYDWCLSVGDRFMRCRGFQTWRSFGLTLAGRAELAGAVGRLLHYTPFFKMAIRGTYTRRTESFDGRCGAIGPGAGYSGCNGRGL